MVLFEPVSVVIRSYCSVNCFFKDFTNALEKLYEAIVCNIHRLFSFFFIVIVFDNLYLCGKYTLSALLSSI